ncbi:MAG: flagellar motor switch protein FliN [Planctomycetota bacterium]|nr:MAG: flagellar motor switch protein FliN [Planctomycetota bacterium]
MPEDAETSPESEDKPAKDAEINQSEVDALLAKAAAQPAEPQGEAATDAAPPDTAHASAEGASEEPPGETDIDTLLAQASAGPAPEAKPDKTAAPAAEFSFDDIQAETAASEKPNIDILKDVGLNVRVELGRRKMFIEDILKLSKGTVVELDKLAGDPLDILVNDKLVAQGEVLVLNENFCIRITRVLSPEETEK